MFGFFGWSWFSGIKSLVFYLDIHLEWVYYSDATYFPMVRKLPYLRLFMASFYCSKYRIRRGHGPRR